MSAMDDGVAALFGDGVHDDLRGVRFSKSRSNTRGNMDRVAFAKLHVPICRLLPPGPKRHRWLAWAIQVCEQPGAVAAAGSKRIPTGCSAWMRSLRSAGRI